MLTCIGDGGGDGGGGFLSGSAGEQDALAALRGVVNMKVGAGHMREVDVWKFGERLEVLDRDWQVDKLFVI